MPTSIKLDIITSVSGALDVEVKKLHQTDRSDDSIGVFVEANDDVASTHHDFPEDLLCRVLQVEVTVLRNPGRIFLCLHRQELTHSQP